MMIQEDEGSPFPKCTVLLIDEDVQGKNASSEFFFSNINFASILLLQHGVCECLHTLMTAALSWLAGLNLVQKQVEAVMHD